jgi:putative hydrolase of the HAD superfamily
LLPYLDARISAADIGYLKPHPFIYLAMLETLQVSPERSVFVGDRPINDIAGANEAGLISVLMAPPHLNRLEESVVPDYTISCLSQLLPILAYLETIKGAGSTHWRKISNFI